MSTPNVVSREEWLDARRKLLQEEKKFTHLREELAELRRALPWVKVEKDYEFGATGKNVSLADLFKGKSQLVMYHFMFGPDWDEGCPSCSFWADNLNGIEIHLAQRDISFVLVSHATIDKLNAYKERMGWSHDWYSASDSNFNSDFNVSFSQEELDGGEVTYNFHKTTFPSTEAPGLSVFYKDDDGGIFHTYSTYARGLDILNGSYHLIDMTPAGRNEAGLPFPMAWVQRHDQYE